ncbi:MAG: bifunctional metallophosphatase/5'-nucleotidase [Clostridiales bacterium]|jgi:2',3'-cyclic-nucleotide 2'-phosphodiesterase (5'-nucleotidase family)|nr:bifunctional metallophosphatase/5'-nucleotidase [Clostridiales bacterium]
MNDKSNSKRILTLLMALMLSAAMVLTGCSGSGGEEGSQSDAEGEGSGKVMVLYTSDIHCGVDDGFGFAGLRAVRDQLESQGYETILVDNGDAIQGDSIGMMSKGEKIIELMNILKYDVATFGNHEFDYTVPNMEELVKKADFPYISCNFTKNGELVYDPYIIKEAGGIKIAFVGVTTPTTLRTCLPEYFQDENGKQIYGFKEGGDGEELYAAVQEAVDSARAEGADYVYIMGHMGIKATDAPWTYADVIEHTSGIDVFLDGHSHDTEQVVMKDKEGKDVVRTACGTKLQAIGYSELSKDEGVIDTNIWTWNNDKSVPDLLGVDNEAGEAVDKALDELKEELDVVIGKSTSDLTIFDPEVKNNDGSPVRMVRRAETNLGDFCPDAIRDRMDADIALVNGGSIRVDLKKGDITYGNILEVFPFNNNLIKLEVTGQQILDALEWGARSLPDENGGFLQVSGMSYEVDVNIPSTCTEEDEMFTGVSGERRVKNVMVGGEPIDPAATYTVAGSDFLLTGHGDGHTAFDGATVLAGSGMLDSEALITYIKETLGGEIGSEYSDPYGDGRIRIIQ